MMDGLGLNATFNSECHAVADSFSGGGNFGSGMTGETSLNITWLTGYRSRYRLHYDTSLYPDIETFSVTAVFTLQQKKFEVV